jgi:hypothetical protein
VMRIWLSLPPRGGTIAGCSLRADYIWRVYMEYCSGERWRRGWWEECTWNAPQHAPFPTAASPAYLNTSCIVII